MADSTPVAMRPCCGDAHERHGEAAPLLGAEMPRLIPADEALPIAALPARFPANTARHEIGHALATILLGGTVGKITIEGQPCAECRLPDSARWRHRVAVDLAGDAATVGELADPELLWHLAAVRNCGGGHCDRCNATRQIVVGLRHPPDEDVIAEFRRIEAVLAEFFERRDVRFIVADLAMWLSDDRTITGNEITERFGSQIRALKLEI